MLSGDDGTTAYKNQTQSFPSYKTLRVFELNIWIHLSVRHRGPAWKYHHPSRVWLSDLSITCENAEEQLPENCEESNHESTTRSGEGANEMGDFQNTPAHARARVTMGVPGAPSVTGQLCCLILCWTQLFLQPKGAHRAKVSKNQNLMWITLQAPLSPGVLSNFRLMSLKSWDQPSILWTGRPQKRVRFPSVLRHILTWPKRKSLVCSGNTHCSGGTAAEKYSKGTKTDFLVTATQHSNWDWPMQAAPQCLRASLLPCSAISACCRIIAALRLVCWPFLLPGHQYLVCSPSLRWIHHCLSEPEVPIYYQRLVHMLERTYLEMKASSNDAWVTWRWASQGNPWAQSPDSLCRSAQQWPAGLTLLQMSMFKDNTQYFLRDYKRWLSAILEKVGEHRHNIA